MLSIEVRDRAAQVSSMLLDRAETGDDEGAALTDLIAQRMPDMAAHAERVARYALSVARELGVPAEVTPALEIAARFHDVGKLAIPDALMTKPSPLTPREMAIMRQHVDIGADILEASRALGEAAPDVRASHEQFGGGGYPRQIAGRDIPLAARIIAVVDAYDAMTQDRSYRARVDSYDAAAELVRCSPAQFDPQIVAAFLAVLGRH